MKKNNIFPLFKHTKKQRRRKAYVTAQYNQYLCYLCADPEWDRGSGPSPHKNHKILGFLSNTSPDPLKNYKATKPAFNVGSSSTHQRNAIKIAFRWRADDGPLLVVIRSSLPSSETATKNKQTKKVTIVDKTFWFHAFSTFVFCSLENN